MSWNAEAHLVYGVDFGAEEENGLPEWIKARFGVSEGLELQSHEHLATMPFELIRYGHHDYPRWALGIKVAWAFDWASKTVNAMEIADRYVEWHEMVKGFLRHYGAPEDTKISLLLLPGDS